MSNESKINDNYYLWDKMMELLYSLKADTLIKGVECQLCQHYNEARKTCGATELQQCPPCRRNMTVVESDLWAINREL